MWIEIRESTREVITHFSIPKPKLQSVHGTKHSQHVSYNIIQITVKKSRHHKQERRKTEVSPLEWNLELLRGQKCNKKVEAMKYGRLYLTVFIFCRTISQSEWNL